MLGAWNVQSGHGDAELGGKRNRQEESYGVA